MQVTTEPVRARTRGPRQHYIEHQLPVGPFREWLLERCHHAMLRTGCDFEHSKRYVGFAIGLSAARIKEYLAPDREWAPYSVVDRVLSTEGGTHMRALYPLEYAVFPIGRRRNVCCELCGSDLIRKAAVCGFCEEELKGLAA